VLEISLRESAALGLILRGPAAQDGILLAFQPALILL
jgi:hypothetical protein